MELNFVGKAQGKCESHRESEGGMREVGSLAQGSKGGSEEKEGKDRVRGRGGG